MSTAGRKCPPFCRSNCKIDHHPVLISLVNSDDTGPSSNNPYATLLALVRKYEQNGQWTKDKNIPDELPEYRYPVLHWASALGKIDLVKFLISRGFPATSRKQDSGDTALHRGLLCLQQTCHKDASKKFQELLVVLQSVLHVQNNRGNTVLHTCSHYLHKEMPKVDYYAECINMIVNQTMTMEKDFLRKMINCQNDDGATALHILAKHDRNLPSLKYLLDTGKALLTVVDEKNLTPLDVAINDGSLKISNYLNSLKDAASTPGTSSPVKSSPTGKKSSSTSSSYPPVKKIRLENSSLPDQQNNPVISQVTWRSSQDSQLHIGTEVERKENGTIAIVNRTAHSADTEAINRSSPFDSIQTTASLVDVSFSQTLLSSTPQAASSIAAGNEGTPLTASKGLPSSHGRLSPAGEKSMAPESRKSITPAADNNAKPSGKITSAGFTVNNGIVANSLTLNRSKVTMPESLTDYVHMENNREMRLSEGTTSEVIDKNAGGDAHPLGSNLFAYLKICDFGPKKLIKDALVNDKVNCSRQMQQITNEEKEIESNIGKKTQDTEAQQKQLRMLLQKVDEMQKTIQILVSQTNHLHQTLLQKGQNKKTLEEKIKTIILALKDLDSV